MLLSTPAFKLIDLNLQLVLNISKDAKTFKQQKTPILYKKKKQIFKRATRHIMDK